MHNHFNSNPFSVFGNQSHIESSNLLLQNCPNGKNKNRKFGNELKNNEQFNNENLNCNDMNHKKTSEISTFNYNKIENKNNQKTLINLTEEESYYEDKNKENKNNNSKYYDIENQNKISGDLSSDYNISTRTSLINSGFDRNNLCNDLNEYNFNGSDSYNLCNNSLNDNNNSLNINNISINSISNNVLSNINELTNEENLEEQEMSQTFYYKYNKINTTFNCNDSSSIKDNYDSSLNNELKNKNYFDSSLSRVKSNKDNNNNSSRLKSNNSSNSQSSINSIINKREETLIVASTEKKYIKNPQYCLAYNQEILSDQKNQESINFPDFKLLNLRSVSLSAYEHLRKKMLHVFYYSQTYFNLKDETINLAINILDRYKINSFNKNAFSYFNDVNNLSLAILFLASKYEEIYPPYLDKFSVEKNKNQILKIEKNIVNTLNYELHTVSPNWFLERYFSISGENKEVLELAKFYLDIGSYKIDFTKLKSSLKACICLYMAIIFFRKREEDKFENKENENNSSNNNKNKNNAKSNIHGNIRNKSPFECRKNAPLKPIKLNRNNSVSSFNGNFCNHENKDNEINCDYNKKNIKNKYNDSNLLNNSAFYPNQINIPLNNSLNSNTSYDPKLQKRKADIPTSYKTTTYSSKYGNQKPRKKVWTNDLILFSGYNESDFKKGAFIILNEVNRIQKDFNKLIKRDKKKTLIKNIIENSVFKSADICGAVIKKYCYYDRYCVADYYFKGLPKLQHIEDDYY